MSLKKLYFLIFFWELKKLNLSFRFTIFVIKSRRLPGN